MIAPKISAAGAVTRLDAMPDRLRAALTGEIERLGRQLRDRLGRAGAVRRRKLARLARLAVMAAPDAVTATLALDKAAPSRARYRPRVMRPLTTRQRDFLHAALDDMRPDMRARLEVAAREALRR